MAHDTIEYISSDGRFGVKVSSQIIMHVRKICSKSCFLETGGLLIGHYTDDLKWAVITEATTPPSGSKRTPTSFVRNGDAALFHLDRAWKKKAYYLGEWHFHPNSSSNPSTTDKNTIRMLANSKNLHCLEPIMYIIGGNTDNWNEYIAVYSNKGLIVLHRLLTKAASY